MAEEKKNLSLNSSFIIEINLKTLLISLVTIGSGLWGFYTKLVEPKFESVNSKFESIEKKQDLYYQELLEIKSGIGVLQGTMSGMDKRIDDLRSSTSHSAQQSSGGAGSPPPTQLNR